MSSFTPSTPFDPSATISRAFEIYRKNASVLLPIAFGIYAVNAIITVAVRGSLAGSLVVSIATAVFGIIFQGIVVELARDVEDGTLDSSVGQLVTAVLPIVLPLFIVGLISGVLIGIGFVLIFVPGLYLMTRWFVVGPVVVLERTGPIAALGRSHTLVTGSGWPVFGVALFNIVLSLVANLIGAAIGSAGGDAGIFIGSWIVSALLAPATALVVAVTYLRLRDAHGDKPLPTGVATADGPQQAF
ncbi:MAG: hypothetical protein AAGC46_19645 [Solirubrobacteraceae bacterium]|nr:hypothetical protein [Patulibacter sp.]